MIDNIKMLLRRAKCLLKTRHLLICTLTYLYKNGDQHIRVNCECCQTIKFLFYNNSNGITKEIPVNSLEWINAFCFQREYIEKINTNFKLPEIKK